MSDCGDSETWITSIEMRMCSEDVGSDPGVVGFSGCSGLGGVDWWVYIGICSVLCCICSTGWVVLFYFLCRKQKDVNEPDMEEKMNKYMGLVADSAPLIRSALPANVTTGVQLRCPKCFSPAEHDAVFCNYCRFKMDHFVEVDLKTGAMETRASVRL